MVRIPDCRSGDEGSIPSRRAILGNAIMEPIKITRKDGAEVWYVNGVKYVCSPTSVKCIEEASKTYAETMKRLANR